MSLTTTYPRLRRGRAPTLAGAVVAVLSLGAACHCASRNVEDAEGSSSEVASSEEGPSSTAATTGAPFDASRWIGRYHYETVFLPFGEHGDPHGPRVLANFEIFADSTASLFYDNCDLEEPIIDEYRWAPDEESWLRLYPRVDGSPLNLVAIENLETLRVHQLEPCRELEFEADGAVVPWSTFYPGASCWVDRCTQPNLMQVWYCEGEEPPPCP
jgi:hypothetical protein